MKWYNFTPIDTLFFRGAEPMNMGESHASKLNFPPPYSTIVGAIRTMVLTSNGVSIKDYYSGKVKLEILEVIGKAGEKENFSVVGPLFKVGDELYIPAPYNRFIEKENDVNAKNKKSIVKLLKAISLKTSLIKSDCNDLLWAKGESGEVISVGGKWIKLKDVLDNKTDVILLSSDDLYCIEPRTGIALETKYRSARKSHIYTFRHIRLKQNVSIVYGIDKDLTLNDKGVLKLGAEQRFGIFEKIIEDIKIPSTSTGQYLALSPVEGNDEANEAVVATGKISYLGGWDLKKGFHKPMVGYFPAGSIFNKKLNNSFISI